MSHGCGDGALNWPQMVCVELITLRNLVNKTLEEFSDASQDCP